MNSEYTEELRTQSQIKQVQSRLKSTDLCTIWYTILSTETVLLTSVILPVL